MGIAVEIEHRGMIGIAGVDLIGIRAGLLRQRIAQDLAGEREAGDDLRAGIECHTFGRHASRFAFVAIRVERTR